MTNYILITIFLYKMLNIIVKNDIILYTYIESLVYNKTNNNLKYPRKHIKNIKELLLSDEEAKKLIKLIKTIAKQHNVTLVPKSKGQIDIVGENNKRFILNYYYSSHSKVFHFRETEHNYTLIRINLNNKFHKNANGEKIWGNRINIFSEEEYYQKGDESTHYRTYPLPYDSISNTDDFFEMLNNLFQYTNTNNLSKVNISIQDNLDLI